MSVRVCVGVCVQKGWLCACERESMGGKDVRECLSVRMGECVGN